MSQEYFCIVSRDGRLVFFSPSLAQALGWTSSELMDRPLLELLHPEDISEAPDSPTRTQSDEVSKQNTFRRWALRSRDSSSKEGRWLCRNGSYRRIRWYFLAQDGWVYGVGRDCFSFQLSNGFTSTYAPSGGIAIYTQDESSKSPSPLSPLVPPITLPSEPLGLGTTSQEHLGLNESKEDRDAFQQTQSRFHHTFNERQLDFLSSFCHEMRNPLAGISGNLELVRNHLNELRARVTAITYGASVNPVTTREEIDEMEENISDALLCVEHQQDLLNNNLDFSKIQARRMVLDRTAFDASEAMLSVCKMLRAKADQKGIRLIAKFPSERIWVLGDELRIKQILINLLGNSLKFTESGQINVSLEIADRRVSSTKLRLEVTDTGIGMSEEELGRLFRLYEQANSCIAAKYGGSGLGLAITRGLVELMGGTIEVHSQKGRGSVFRCLLELPHAEEDEVLSSLRRRSLSLSPKRVRRSPSLEVALEDGDALEQNGLITIRKRRKSDAEEAARPVERTPQMKKTCLNNDRHPSQDCSPIYHREASER